MRSESPVEQFELKNGLQVTVRPIQGAKTVAVLTLFDVGGNFDPPGKSGLAHLVEHLYVSAATPSMKSRTAQEFMQAYPAGWNAQTGRDYTVIATVADGESLDDEIQQAAQRMSALQIEQSDLDREIPRVLDELQNMFVRIPKLAAPNQAGKRLRPMPHEGRHGGVPDEVRRLALEDVRSHWRAYYKPCNARLIVAGKVDSALCRTMIRESFDEMETGRALPDPPPSPPAEYGEIRNALTKDQIARGARPYVSIAFRCPEPGEPHFATSLAIVAHLQTLAVKESRDPRSFPLAFAVLDAPGTLYLSSEVKQEESTEEVKTRLESLVDNFDPDLAIKNIHLATMQFGLPLGTSVISDKMLLRNPYSVAFSLGRQQQLGIDGAELAEALAKLDANKMRHCMQQNFSAERRVVSVVE